MSYEGTDHYLCPNGHYLACDAIENMHGGIDPMCPHCGLEWALEFNQDQTNGEDPEYPYTMYPDLEILFPSKLETCNMGHQHIVEPMRYKLPLENALWRKYSKSNPFPYED